MYIKLSIHYQAVFVVHKYNKNYLPIGNQLQDTFKLIRVKNLLGSKMNNKY